MSLLIFSGLPPVFAVRFAHKRASGAGCPEAVDGGLVTPCACSFYVHKRCPFRFLFGRRKGTPPPYLFPAKLFLIFIMDQYEMMLNGFPDSPLFPSAGQRNGGKDGSLPMRKKRKVRLQVLTLYDTLLREENGLNGAVLEIKIPLAAHRRGRGRLRRGADFIMRKLPIVSIVILALNLIGGAVELIAGFDPIFQKYCIYQGALEDTAEWYRIFSSAFIHGDVFHLLSNMICLISFGFLLEPRIGKARYAIVYVAGIIGSAVMIHFTGGDNAGHLGASGAVWALMSAAFVNLLFAGENLTGIFRCIIFNLVYSFSSGVSWQGHLGGCIAGFLVALLLCRETGPGRAKFRVNAENETEIVKNRAYREWKKTHPHCSDDFFVSQNKK